MESFGTIFLRDRLWVCMNLSFDSEHQLLVSVIQQLET